MVTADLKDDLSLLQQAAHTVRALESVWACREVLSPISCQFGLADSFATGFLFRAKTRHDAEGH